MKDELGDEIEAAVSEYPNEYLQYILNAAQHNHSQSAFFSNELNRAHQDDAERSEDRFKEFIFSGSVQMYLQQEGFKAHFDDDKRELINMVES